VHESDAEQVVDGKDPLPLDPDVPAERPFARNRRSRSLPPWRVLAVIAIGGFAGGLARYELGLAFPAHRGEFPAATFGINVSGSFVLALLIVLVLEVWPPTTYIRPLLGVGFCGAYTTFSTWMVGVDQLFSDGKAGTALWYLIGSLIAGLGATSLGLTGGRAVVSHRHRMHATRETRESPVTQDAAAREARETTEGSPA
jgi:CrcB protein